MFKTAFLFLLLIHVIGDYYFQSNELAKRKCTSILSLLKHCTIYAVICVLFLIPVYDPWILLGLVMLAGSHLVIDLIKYMYIKRIHKKKLLDTDQERRLYIVDQLMHMFSIALIAFVFAVKGIKFTALPYVHLFFETIGIPASVAFCWILALLIIYKPVNVSIKKLITLHKPLEITETADTISSKEINVGGFIGLLERLIILVLLSVNQYSAIGLVLAAKSIARYDKISKDQSFAEYYLLGTLLSTISVIITYLFLF